MNPVVQPYLIAYGAVVLIVVLILVVYLAILHHPDTRRGARPHRSAKGGFFF